MGPGHDPEAGASGAAGGGGDARERWEVGQPDYMGSASFDNILRKIDSTMTTPGECGKRERAKEEVARSVRACAVTGARRGESERATERVA